MKFHKIVILVFFLLFVMVSTLEADIFIDSNIALGNEDTQSLMFGDVNGDADMDIIEAYNGAILIYIGEADSAFSAAYQLNNGNDIEDIVLGDLNNDGSLDIVAICNGNSDIIYWNDNTGIGNPFSLTDTTIILNSNLASQTGALGDLDNDGDLDLVVGVKSDSNLVFIWSDNNFTLKQKFSVGGAEALTYDILIADLNGDSYLDIAEANYSTSITNKIFLNQGNARFSKTGIDIGSSTDDYSYSLAAGDIDNDGAVDLLYANDPSGGRYNRIVFNDGTGTFNSNENFGDSYTTKSYALALGDINDDGLLDVLASYEYFASGNAWVRVFINTGGPSDYITNSATQNCNIGCNARPYCLVMADVNQDGGLDFLAANRATTLDCLSNALFLNDTDSTFTAPTVPNNLSTTVGTPLEFAWSGASDDNGIDNLTYNVRISNSLGDTVYGSEFYHLDETDINNLPKMGNVWYNTTYADTLPLGIYSWSVQAIDNSYLRSQWSITDTLLNDSPPSTFSLLSPLDESIIAAPFDLIWQRSIDIDEGNGDTLHYYLYYDDIIINTSDDSQLISGALGVNDTIYNSTNLIAENRIENHTYYWQVIVRDSFGLEQWSDESYTFTINTYNELDDFNLISPLSGTVLCAETVDLIWQVANEPDPYDTVTYHLYFDTIPIDTTTKSAYAITQDTTYNIINLIDNTAYYWRVKAIDLNGGYKWTNEYHFTVNAINDLPGAFALLYPLESAELTNLSTTLIWEESYDPDALDTLDYYIYYSISDLDTILPQGHTRDSTFLIDPLQDNSFYTWRVKAEDTQGAIRWSTAEGHFTINQENDNPLPFVLISPEDGSLVGSDVTLVWQSSSDIDPNDFITYYSLIYDTLSDFSTPYEIRPIIDTTYIFTAELQQNKTYYWKIKAVDTNNAETWSAQSFGFIFDSTAIELTSFSLEEVSNGLLISWTTDGIDDCIGFDLHRIENNHTTHTYNISSNNTIYEYIDRNVQIGNRYDYYLDILYRNGGKKRFGPYTINYISIPTTNQLLSNYPNPFNPNTTIHYQLATSGSVDLSIYNVQGQLVKTLINEKQNIGIYNILWNGKDNTGQLVSSGIYLCRLKFNEIEIATQSLILLK